MRIVSSFNQVSSLLRFHLLKGAIVDFLKKNLFLNCINTLKDMYCMVENISLGHVLSRSVRNG